MPVGERQAYVERRVRDMQAGEAFYSAEAAAETEASNA
jgi:hypothetical protein